MEAKFFTDDLSFKNFFAGFKLKHKNLCGF